MLKYFGLVSVQLDSHCFAKSKINIWKPCAVSCRLRLARARHALEYYSFFHSATYTLKHPTSTQSQSSQSSKFPLPEATPALPNVTEVTPTVMVPMPPSARDPRPTLLLPPPPVVPPPSCPPNPPVVRFPLTLPLIEATPPSPHLSWGACSDADVYSRIGAIRPSRLSSMSNQSKVILFEHSSLWPLLHRWSQNHIYHHQSIKQLFFVECNSGEEKRGGQLGSPEGAHLPWLVGRARATTKIIKIKSDKKRNGAARSGGCFYSVCFSPVSSDCCYFYFFLWNQLVQTWIQFNVYVVLTWLPQSAIVRTFVFQPSPCRFHLV